MDTIAERGKGAAGMVSHKNKARTLGLVDRTIFFHKQYPAMFDYPTMSD